MKSANLRVLAIEDSIDDSDLVRIMLARVQNPIFTVVNAHRLAEGLQRLREQTFDAVLLDLGLPDSVGIDAVKAVRKECPDVPRSEWFG